MMGQNASEQLFTLQVTSGTCGGVAILTTLVRIAIRVRRQSKFWVDDALAVFSAAAIITQFVAVCLNPAQHNGIVRYYLITNMFYAAIWSARLSILFSLVRITKNLHSNRFLYTFGVLFFAAWLFFTAQLYWECETRTAWKRMAIPQCHLSIAVPICQIVADVVSDSVLLIAPIRILMVITDRKLRYRAMIIFSTCIVTTIVSLVHAAYIFQSKALPELVSGIVENAVSLIICNVPIMVVAMIKLKEKKYVQISTLSAAVPRFKKSIGTGQSTVPTAVGSTTSVVNVQLSDLGCSSKSVSMALSKVEEEIMSA